MAHYVAELVARADSASLPERDQVQRECFRAILDLWAHASAYPTKRSAFGPIDRVIEVMNSLHPDANPYYRNSVWHALEDQPSSEDLKQLLTAALGIDGAARSIIHYVLTEASRVAGRDCAEWLELAQHLGEVDPATEIRVRIVKAGQEESASRAYRADQLQSRIDQLSHFIVVANALKATLTKELATAKERDSGPAGEAGTPRS
jgi:hypothetical protein